jgi:hypothetical protein
MPPLHFCYWRCYSSDESTFRRKIDIYLGNPVDNGATLEALRGESQVYSANGAIRGQLSGGSQAATNQELRKCRLVDDMYYCGGLNCQVCDYEF